LTTHLDVMLVAWSWLVMVLAVLVGRKLWRRYARPANRAAHPPAAAAPPAVAAATEAPGQAMRQAAPALAEHFRQWGVSARSTAPIDRTRMEAAVHALYAGVGLKAPRIVVVASPLAMMVAYSLATALVWTRKHHGPWTWTGPPEPCDDSAIRGARADGSYFLQNRAADYTGYARSAAMNKTRGMWELLRRDLPPEIDRMEHEGMAHLDREFAGGVRDRLQGLASRDPETQAQWATQSLGAYTTAADAAVQAACGHPAGPATAATLDGLRAWLGRRTCAREQLCAHEQLLHTYLDGCFQEAAHPLRWAPLQRDVPVIGATRFLLDEPGREFEWFKVWEACAREVGDLLAHEEFCIVSERPQRIQLDEQQLLHCADGPSALWRDGWSLYHWHGVRMPPEHEYVINDPGLITVARIDGELNSEIRRAMIERFGAARYVMEGNATVVHTVPPNHELVGLRGARLLQKQAPFHRELVVFVELVNSTPEPDGTCKRYMLRVDPQAYQGQAALDCHAAVASTWRRADGSLAYERYTDYRPVAES
jgi:hypothetical protein